MRSIIITMAPPTLKLLLTFHVILSVLAFPSQAQTCGNYAFASNQVFQSCTDLPYLNAFVHWTYNTSSAQLRLAYRHTQITTASWVAWAVNPSSPTMLGAQALVAYQQPNGSMRAYTSPISTSSYQTNLAEGDLSFAVSDLSAAYVNGEMIIFATLSGLPDNATTINQVWQDGPLRSGNPSAHDSSAAEHISSKGTLNLLSGQSGGAAGGGGSSRIRKRNIHGVLNAVSWGILMPTGAVIARYLKVFKSADPAWFYLHVACQSSAYVVGVSGWATGLKLGSDSKGIQYNTHRAIGITLFCLGTLQLFALLLRPNKDHKYRIFWNVYHHAVGYAVISLSITNIYEGFDILKPDNKWKQAYTGIIIALGVVAVFLEAYTWFVVIKRKRCAKAPPGINGANGVNGHGRV